MFLIPDRAADSGGSIATDNGASIAPAPAFVSSGPPYVSGGGFSSPSVGSTIANLLSMRPADTTPSMPIATPTLGIGGHTVDHTAPGASGTPSATGGSTSGSGTTTTTPAVGSDYFHDILDLVTSQLATGQPSATQQFSATPVALPSGSYSGSASDSGTAVAAPRRPWLGLVILLGVAGAAYYWFVWRKKHGAGGAA